MAEAGLQVVVRHVRRLTGRAHDSASGDHEFVEAFCRRRDEEAFAALLQRHGAMVRDVCRRVLGADADADDASQAVFLVLARRAGTIRRRQSLASWLYGVAYRVCQRTRRDEARRRQRELRVARPIAFDPDTKAELRELSAELDAELYRLPQQHRAPLIHCYLQGQTRDQAARDLGLSVRTLDRRLERGRELLRRRLERRGLTLSATMLAVGLSPRAAQCALPASFLRTTLQAALKVSAGIRPTPGEVSARATNLMEAVLQSLFLEKLKIVALLLVAVATTGGAAHMVLRAWRDEAEQRAPRVITVSSSLNLLPGSRNAVPRTDLFGDPLPSGAVARLGSVRWRLQGELAEVMVVTPDGKELVSADRKRGFSLWDAAIGSVRRYVPADPARQQTWLPAQAVALSADGRRGALADAKGIIHVVDMGSGEEIANCRSPNVPVEEMALSARGTLLAVRSKEGALLLWDAGKGREPRMLGPQQRGPGDTRNIYSFPNGELALSPEGDLLAWVGKEEDRRVHLYDTAKGQELPSLGKYSGNRRFITFSPDGHQLASLSDESPGQVWDIVSRKEIIGLPSGRNNLTPVAAFSPDSKALALKVPSDALYVLELPSGRQRWKLNRRTISTNRQDVLAFTPDGETLILNSYDPVLYRYSAASGRRLGQPGEESDGFVDLVFSSDGRNVFTLGTESSLRQWDAETGKELHRTTMVPFFGGQFSPDGRLSAVGGAQGVHVYDTALRQERWHSPEGWVNRFSGDSKLLAVSADVGLILRDTATGNVVQRLKGAGTFAYVAFSPDGRRVLVNDGNAMDKAGRVHIWDIASGKELRAFPVPANACYIDLSPDGRTLSFQRGVGDPGGAIELWEVATGQRRLACERPDQYSVPARLAFTPDGRYITIADHQGDLKFHDVTTGKVSHRLARYPNLIGTWSFTRDQRKLATTRSDMTALIWDLTALAA
ncbi:MAG TPA: sigma-70 family RNA polymerase sigma factor, partial [Gemmataceae bacterium]|nr:sigma-70 family RNA polymerase sigma factor [Gemmataceae bacterium]